MDTALRYSQVLALSLFPPLLCLLLKEHTGSMLRPFSLPGFTVHVRRGLQGREEDRKPRLAPPLSMMARQKRDGPVSQSQR